MSATPQQITEAIAAELAESKYRFEEPWYAALIESLQRAWARFVEWLIRISEAVGGPIVAGVIIGLVALAGVILITRNLGRRRAHLVEQRLRRERNTVRGLDPAELERDAEQAAADGSHTDALRLQFQALLIRLDQAGLIDLRPGSTTGLLDEQLDSYRFHAVANRFDAVVYGGSPGRADDRQAVVELARALMSRA